MSTLGVESSCDETDVALYDAERGLLTYHLHAQMAMYTEYGGVVSKLASRDHIRRIVPLTQGYLKEAGVGYADIGAVVFTQGSGLGDTLLIGSGSANALAFAIGGPAIPVHHLEGHLLSPLLVDDRPEFPFVVLLVSGGHTQSMVVRDTGDYTLLGENVDDTTGEAFNRTAKLLGPPYPNDAKLSELARLGTPDVFTSLCPMLYSHGLRMNFSGLKTAVLTTAEKIRAETSCDEVPEQTHNNTCHASQDAVVDVLAVKARKVLLDTGFRTLVVANGVGVSWKLRDELSRLTVKMPSERGKPKPQEEKVNVYFPPMAYYTDDGIVTAFAGAMRLAEH